MHPDERKASAVQFLRNAVAYYRLAGRARQRVLTDNGSAFRSKAFGHACQQLGIKHSFTRAYRPQTNGKAERFIQSALREWAYGFTYQHSASAPPCSSAGSITTTGIALTRASEASHLCPDSVHQETTS